MDFLIEIGVEEMPARFCAGMVDSLRAGLTGLVERERLAEGAARAETFVTPRRMAVRIEGLRVRQEDRTEVITGPPARAAFDAEGRPTKAAQGFVRSKGGRPEDLQRVRTEKGEYAALTVRVPGRPSSEVLAEKIPEVVAGIPLPIAMKWGESRGPFLRPVRWVVALLGAEVIPLELHGIRAGRESQGHRVLGPGPVPIPEPCAYEAALQQAGVIPNPAARYALVSEGHAECSLRFGMRSVEDEELAHELVHLTEFPVPVAGRFDARYLDLPVEVVLTCMRHHQRFFGMESAEGKLFPGFVAILNNKDPEGSITRGCEEVLRARLEDARFFFEEDRKRPLADSAPALERVIFQEKLGSYAAKTERMRWALGEIAATVPAAELERAILLGRADLVTRMVGEFPELQGIVGGLYARLDREPGAVADAIRDLYRPVGIDDALPAGAVGRWLGILDRMDTIVGCLGVGVEVTGSKDLFGLRRAALALSRLLAERPDDEPDVSLRGLLDAARTACEGNPDFDPGKAAGAKDLIENRLRFFFESKGYPYDEVNAVLASEAPEGRDDPRDLLHKLRAVHAVRQEGRLDALSIPFKRIRNILREAPPIPPGTPLADDDPFSVRLWTLAQDLRTEMAPHLEADRYREALDIAARVQAPLDEFFIKVLVMHPEEKVRAFRLRTLGTLRSLFLRIFDPSEIVGTGAETKS